jgi:hypothetical protein
LVLPIVTWVFSSNEPANYLKLRELEEGIFFVEFTFYVESSFANKFFSSDDGFLGRLNDDTMSALKSNVCKHQFVGVGCYESYIFGRNLNQNAVHYRRNSSSAVAKVFC